MPGMYLNFPFDEELFLEKLDEHRRTSRAKENVQEVTFNTEGTYGSREK